MTHIPFTVTRDGADIDLLVELGSYTPARRGRTWGPAEHCYPDEPAEVEIGDIYLDAPGRPLWAGGLTADERALVEEELFELAAEQAADAEDAWADEELC